MKKTLLTILTVVLAFCSVGLVACGHTCVYDKEVANTSTLAQEATCTSPALYYYSCECGNNGTDMFEVGEALGHNYTAETVKDDALITAASCQTAATYHKSCVNCGEVSTNEADVFTVGDILDHNYDINNNCLCIYGCGQSNQFIPRRVGEEANTLLFFDQEIGVDQVSIRNNIQYWYKYTPELSTAKVYGDETASLAIVIEKQVGSDDYPLIANQEDECIYWNTAEYEFNQGDYVVFCVYNDTASDIIDISLGNTHRQRCLKGQWTMVIWSAADFVADGGFSRLFERDSNGNWAGDTTGLAGTVYFSKAKVYSSDQVKNLTEVEDTFEYTVGNSTFIGKAAEVNGNYNPDKNAFNDPTYAMPYYVNGVLRWNANSKINTQALDFWPKMGFTFKEAKEVTVNTYLYLTLGNDVKVAGSFHVQAFNSDGFVAVAQLGGSAIKGELVEGSTYRFHIGKYAGTAAAKDFKLFRLCADWVGYPTSTHFVVTDVTVINVTAG